MQLRVVQLAALAAAAAAYRVPLAPVPAPTLAAARPLPLAALARGRTPDTGKTHSLFGRGMGHQDIFNPAAQGLCLNLLRELFERIEQSPEPEFYSVGISCYDVWNNEVCMRMAHQCTISPEPALNRSQMANHSDGQSFRWPIIPTGRPSRAAGHCLLRLAAACSRLCA